jgi:hypothetical protein
MGLTACTEPQCLYKGALYLFFIITHSNGVCLCVCVCVCVALVIQQVERMRNIRTHCLWPVWIYNIFPHYLKKRHDFRNKTKIVFGHKIRVLIFSITFIRNTSRSKKTSARYYRKCIRTLVFICYYHILSYSLGAIFCHCIYGCNPV